MPISDQDRKLGEDLAQALRTALVQTNIESLDDFMLKTGGPFVIKKLVAIPIEFLLDALVGLARGPLKAPGIIIGENVLTGTAGHGEEDAIQRQIERDNEIRLIILAIRSNIFGWLGGTDIRAPIGAAMRLVKKDP